VELRRMDWSGSPLVGALSSFGIHFDFWSFGGMILDFGE